MSELEELKLDLAEVQQVLSTLKRQTNIDHLNNRVKFLENSIKILTPQKVEQPEQQQQQKDQDTLIYQGITKYAWDQEGNKVKVFLNLEGIGQFPKENITSFFAPNSVDVKIKGYKGLNHRFSIKKTFDELKNKECSIKVTNNSIVVNLVKKDPQNWDQLNYKGKIIDTDPSKLDQSDPQASLMTMMKEMYQNGDENMKRTIAQAWSKSQEEQGMK
ncbi:unnamed protein product (macronuclear) [Paramecium tetraurelia]|uniref:Calcyclin-binding protein n=1 Tax=Paramecium tetraurelia TaxID=5888 RepID=A0D3Z9_PARTE|nr:uncharacterized protein GSPATT00013231001 [Paramecium tetraurelia]CAK77766.1 unnamed protein product [Paramecium tetraurelia]|eukprot:XP_001445163.1 hypothetical protein (macronuclear) [Paramecium tetraurelia strain d4-2]